MKYGCLIACTISTSVAVYSACAGLPPWVTAINAGAAIWNYFGFWENGGGRS